MHLLLALATLLLTSCSYSENGGESWNRIQFFPSSETSMPL